MMHANCLAAFRTDADISSKGKGGRERTLQAWQAGTEGTTPPSGQFGDDVTFGPAAAGSNSWDQFAVNEKLFGVKTNFDENVYTTKLDRSGADFKEREREAQKLANEIIGVSSSSSTTTARLVSNLFSPKGATNNSHVAEERNMNVDDSGVNEEDKCISSSHMHWHEL